MTTRDALCRESLEEQIRKHTATINDTTNLTDIEATTMINKSSNTSDENPGPSEIVSAIVEPTNSYERNDELTNNGYCNEIQRSDNDNIDGSLHSEGNEPISKVPSKVNASYNSSNTSSIRSLRQLQQMALTTFARTNWIAGKYETIEVELCRDPVVGLGITIAGYVHNKEEINGVFVKSLVPNSSAFHSRKIQLNDLIFEVNEKSLEGLNHSESIRALVGSGTRVKIKLIRFLPGSPQAECLTMLQRQDVAAQEIDVQNTLRDVVAYWKHRLGSEFEVISVDLIPDKFDDGGLGISLEGTVDILNGAELCPHHYIDSLRPGGPAAFSNSLRSGDELLQANEVVLYGESHVTVRQALIKAATNAQRVRLTVARKVQTVNVFMPRLEESLPIAYPLLAGTDDRLIKAKSESCIARTLDSTRAVLEQVSRRLRSRSLQLFNGLAIWRCVPMIVQLEKDSRGLGFSIVDYRDPLHPEQSVIVVRSLVPGGLAQADGRIIPGDRLMFVNDEDLSNSTLEYAVAILKSAPDGLVRLGIAKPIPIEECGNGISGHTPLISRSERVLAKGSSRSRQHHRKEIISNTSSQETVWLGAAKYHQHHHPQSCYQSSSSLTPTTPRACNISLNGSHLSMTSSSPCSTRSISPCGSPLYLRGSWAYDIVYLPPSLERSIKIQKGALSLGVVLNAEIDKGINGCQVKSICSKKAVGRDGRVQVNDYIVKVNMESLRNVTNSQARAILKRTNLIGTQCNITYITASDAKIWKEKYHHETDYQLPVVNRLSPRIFPKFYHSLYLEKKQMTGIGQGSFNSDVIDAEISLSSDAPKSAKRQSDSIQIDGKSIEEFVYNFVQKILKDVWMELLVTEHLTKVTNFGASKENWQNLLSEPVETSPSTSVASQKVLAESKLSNSCINETQFENGKKYLLASIKEKDSEMDERKKCRNEGSQKKSAITVPSEQLNLLSETVERNSLIEDELINPAVPSDLSPSPVSSETHLPAKSSRSKFWGQTKTVILHREPNQSFGISIVGGRVEVSHKSGQPGTRSTVSGIFIKSVLPNSPAGLSNMMNMGDRVISVNDQDLREATHEQAVQVIKNAKNPVKFVVQSLRSFPSHQGGINEEQDERRNESDKSVSEWKRKTEKCDSSSLMSTFNVPEATTKKEDELEFEDMERHDTTELVKNTSISMDDEKLERMQSLKNLSRKRVNTRKELVKQGIDMDSAAALPKHDDDPEEEDLFFYTKDKINRKYGNLSGDTILLKLDNVPRGGLGLSLAGNRDRDRMIVLVVAVKSTCPLSVKIGDELLEVNGKVLTGLSHLNASSIMRECCESGILELLLLRRFEALAITLDSRKFDRNNTVGNKLQMSSSSETDVQHSAEDAKNKLSQQNGIETGRETLIEIAKNGKGLGLSIVGGSDTVLGTVVIHEVYADGAAAIDGRLKPGDQVLEVNGVSLRGVSHEQAILLLRRTPAKVSLLVYRDVNLQLSLLDPTQIYNIFEVELTKKPSRGLGLSIVGRKNEPGVYVSEVVKGGAAEADGRLLQGDQILAVNGQDVASSMQEDVAAKLKACTGRVTLRVGRWKLTEAANKVNAGAEAALSNTTQQSKLIKATPEIKLFAPNNEDSSVSLTLNDPKTKFLPTSTSTSKCQISKNEENQPPQIICADLSPVTEESSSGADQKSSFADEESSPATSLGQSKEIELIEDLNEENSDTLLVVLKKIPDQQLGMGIGKRTRGILVTSLQPGSIAAEKLRVGDRLMAVNGVAITDQLSAVALVKASGKKLWLQISRPRIYQNP
ncbi:unnamed protein product [Cercopithifilaria johnstoni]|uniref:PDZ domain-containing protein n=1 Tax=Cercopithifilaria johnstoni TaxID=2874296 RepID=A0A8J2Q1H5_9BILA|nr:unnamed protein product [Cercopithifilaria johnstoni]